ncbi:hypothetical protein BC628DRAFT_1014855 [Trametes gibbosa]|nr:hypothetical protein BC628DRAFT_1014855 [Trametes gibbosa]
MRTRPYVFFIPHHSPRPISNSRSTRPPHVAGSLLQNTTRLRGPHRPRELDEPVKIPTPRPVQDRARRADDPRQLVLDPPPRAPRPLRSAQLGPKRAQPRDVPPLQRPRHHRVRAHALRDRVKHPRRRRVHRERRRHHVEHVHDLRRGRALDVRQPHHDRAPALDRGERGQELRDEVRERQRGHLRRGRLSRLGVVVARTRVGARVLRGARRHGVHVDEGVRPAESFGQDVPALEGRRRRCGGGGARGGADVRVVQPRVDVLVAARVRRAEEQRLAARLVFRQGDAHPARTLVGAQHVGAEPAWGAPAPTT